MSRRCCNSDRMFGLWILNRKESQGDRIVATLVDGLEVVRINTFSAKHTSVSDRNFVGLVRVVRHTPFADSKFVAAVVLPALERLHAASSVPVKQSTISSSHKIGVVRPFYFEPSSQNLSQLLPSKLQAWGSVGSNTRYPNAIKVRCPAAASMPFR